MLQLRYTCDWCGVVKAKGARWVLGFAAERRGLTSLRREFWLAERWSDREAQHRLAVHFCSPEHAEKYALALLGRMAQPKRGANGGSGAQTPGRTTAAAAAPARSKTSRATARTASGKRAARPAAKRRTRTTEADRLRAHALGIKLE